MSHPTTQLILIRHGETEWSLSGKHTSTTDLSLTEHGREQGGLLAKKIKKDFKFENIICSPLKRAQETCQIAGLFEKSEPESALTEWNYGDYEGVKTVDIRKEDPDWFLFRDGCPNGESPNDLAKRVDELLDKIKNSSKYQNKITAAFTSGHISRVIGARWVGLDVLQAGNLYLSTANISILGFEREVPVIRTWNDTSHLPFSRGH